VSSRYRILVLSKEQHARMLLRQMDYVLGELDETIRQEALSMEANRADAEKPDAEVSDEATADRLKERSLDETSRSEQLADTHSKMEALIAEAVKNDQFQNSTLADWTKISQDLANTAMPAMGQAARLMRNAAAASRPQTRRDGMEEAVREQQRALEAMRQNEQDLNDSVERSMAESFVNRFRQLAKRQKQIGESMERLLPKTVGMTPGQLPRELAETVQTQAGEQTDVFKETRYVYDDLRGFYRRSRIPVLRDVTKDMEDERYAQRLPELRNMISENVIGRTTAEADEWNRLFLQWAEMLTPPQQDGGGGGQGGGGEGEDLETMIALARARVEQETYRRHTRTLDESYPENPTYHRDAVKVSDRQYELAQSLLPLENKVKKDETKKLISLASGLMLNAGVKLRRPDTGQDTVAIQTEVIERLAAALSQCMSGSPSNSGDAQQQQENRAMMRALMRMMEGASGGEGMTGGGDPNREADRGGSAPLAGKGNEDGEKAGGSDPTRWPGRYREMMDAYFNAIEESGP